MSLEGRTHDKKEATWDAIPPVNLPIRLYYDKVSEQLFMLSLDGTTARPVVSPEELANVLEGHLNLCFEVVQLTKQGETRKIADPSKPMLQRMLAETIEGLRGRLPVLSRFANTPVIAPDGTLVTAPGLHPSGIYYRGPEIKPLPPRPDLKLVRKAVKFIERLFQDFPFDNDESRQAYWAYLLTPFASEVIERPYPLANFSATAPGSGKTMLSLIPGMIYLGYEPSLASLDKADETEIRKTLTSILASSSSLWIIFDNLKGRLDSGVLEAFITTKFWQDRLLGSSRIGKWPNNAIVAITANNLTMSKDLERRQILIRLTPMDPDPHLRTDFQIPDLGVYIRKHREQLIWCICVILQNWIALGLPLSERRLGSFESWSAGIGGILESAGIGTEFLGQTRVAVRESDPWGAFMDLWQKSHVSKERQPASELVRFASPAGLNLAAAGPAQSLGVKLNRQVDRVFRLTFGVFRLDLQSSGNARLWSLVRVEKNPERSEKVSEASSDSIQSEENNSPSQNSQVSEVSENGLKTSFQQNKVSDFEAVQQALEGF